MTDEELKKILKLIAQNPEILAEILLQLPETQKAKLMALIKQQATGIKIKTIQEALSDSTVGQDKKFIERTEKTGLGDAGAISIEEKTTIRTYDCGHPSLGVKNFGGKCQIRECGRTFCNTISGNKPLCYRRCVVCHRMLCMRHARTFDKTGEIYCSLFCYIKKKLKLV